MIIFILALLPLMIYLCWYVYANNPYLGYSSYFDGVSIDINGKGKTKTIFAFTPERYPEDHYIFLPSSAILSETKIYYKKADVLLLSFENEGDKALYSGGNLSNIETDKIYQAAFMTKAGEVLEKGKVMFMQSRDTAAVYVDTASGTMEHIYADKEHRERGKIYIEDSHGKIEHMGDLRYIKGHGNTTWKEDKKSLGFVLDDAADLFGMGASYDWVLMANCLDETMMANSIVYDLARNAGMKYTAEMVYADLYLNGHYNGLYQIAERNEVAPGRIDLTDLKVKNQRANTAIDPLNYEAYSVNSGEPGERQALYLPYDPVDITGGYLVEHDYGEKYDSEVSKFRTKSGDRYVLRSPVYASKAEVDYIAGVFEELENRTEKGEDVSDLIDTESFADKYLLEEIVKNDGAGATSSYFYKDSDSVDPLLHAGPAWDYDMALGNSGRGLTDIADHLDFCTNHIQHTLVFYNLYCLNSDYRDLVKKNYSEKFRPLLIELLNGGLEDYVAVVDKGDDMNTARWQRGPEERSEAVAVVRNFLEKRIEFLDSIWIRNEKLHIVHLEKDSIRRNPYIGVPDGGTMEILPDPRSGGSEGEVYWVDKESGERVDENTKIYKDMTLISSAYYEEGS